MAQVLKFGTHSVSFGLFEGTSGRIPVLGEKKHHLQHLPLKQPLDLEDELGGCELCQSMEAGGREANIQTDETSRMKLLVVQTATSRKSTT